MSKPKIVKLERPPNPYLRDQQMAIRINSEEMEHLKKMAALHTAGNVSEYVRYAAVTFQPPES